MQDQEAKTKKAKIKEVMITLGNANDTQKSKTNEIKESRISEPKTKEAKHTRPRRP